MFNPGLFEIFTCQLKYVIFSLLTKNLYNLTVNKVTHLGNLDHLQNEKLKKSFGAQRAMKEGLSVRGKTRVNFAKKRTIIVVLRNGKMVVKHLSPRVI